MPYQQLEQLTSRKQEKVAMFVTAEQMAGVLAIGLPVYIATNGTAFWLRILCLIAAAVLGLLLTTDVGGMTAYERALWWIRGRVRRRFAGATITPAEMTASPIAHQGTAMPIGGSVRRLPWGRERERVHLAPVVAPHVASGVASHVVSGSVPVPAAASSRLRHSPAFQARRRRLQHSSARRSAERKPILKEVPDGGYYDGLDIHASEPDATGGSAGSDRADVRGDGVPDLAAAG